MGGTAGLARSGVGVLIEGGVSEGEAACGELACPELAEGVEAVISCTSRSGVSETIVRDVPIGVLFAGVGSVFESGVRSSV